MNPNKSFPGPLVDPPRPSSRSCSPPRRSQNPGTTVCTLCSSPTGRISKAAAAELPLAKFVSCAGFGRWTFAKASVLGPRGRGRSLGYTRPHGCALPRTALPFCRAPGKARRRGFRLQPVFCTPACGRECWAAGCEGVAAEVSLVHFRRDLQVQEPPRASQVGFSADLSLRPKGKRKVLVAFGLHT